MTDIVKAIAKENEYLSYRMKGEEPFHLVDVIKEYGFESLHDYYEAKKKYQFSTLNFEVIETTPANAITEVLNVISQKKTAVLFANTEHTIVWNGDGSQLNESYCKDCDIPIYPLYTSGGTIVSTLGDLNIGICVPDNYMSGANYFLDNLACIFRKYTDKSVEVVGNDVLVDGYKVLGASTYHTNGMFMFITPVSLSEKSKLIQNICLKHSEKIPNHIDFMDGATLKLEVEKWLGILF